LPISVDRQFAPSVHAVVRYLSCLRLQEILVLQGSPLVGAAFALRRPATEQMESVVILVAANAWWRTSSCSTTGSADVGLRAVAPAGARRRLIAPVG
jgi:hypothetical protein